jgi:serine/threonine-protein kinase
MTSKQAHTVSREAQLGADGLGLTPSAKLGRNLSREKSRTFLPYSTEAAEYDLLRILQGLSQGYKRRGKRVLLKPVLVFDELDKIDSYHVTEESVIPNPYIRHIFGTLKTLLTTSGVSFICVAGRDFYELWRVQVARGDSVLESVFAHHIYLECLWQLPRQLLRQVTPQKVTRKGITRRLVNTPKERKESSLADKFEGYLRYQSRGIARRLHRELNRFVSWYNDGLALVFDDNAMRRIDFYDELERVLREHKDWFMSPIVDFDDRGLLKDEYQSVAYLLTDRLLRFQEDAFTITQLVRSAGEVGVELKNKGLDKLANAVIRALKNRHYVEVVENPTSLPVQIIGNREDAASTKKTYYQLTPWVVLRLQDLQGGSDEDIVEPKSKEWLEIGRLGSYDIVDKLGDGGLAIVYLGRNFRTYQRAAIKVARDSGGSIDVNAALEQEVRALQRAAGAGVVTAYGLQEEEPYHYLVLDYCEGKTLEDLIANRSNPLPRKMSVTLIFQIALILQSIHRKGVYRIDLKPSNIAFDRGKMVLIDFGTALIEGDEASLEWKRLPMGTPDYAAPELVSNPMSVDKRADLYALGVIFYQLLTGSPPARVEPDYTILPHDLAPIIRRLLANNLEDRYSDVSTFLRAFPTEVMMSVSEVYEILSEDLQESRVQRSQRTDIIPQEVAKSKRATQPVAKHIPPQSMAPKAAPLSATGSPSGPPSGTPVLVMPNGDMRPLDKEKILFGRLKTCDVVIDDREVSRIHALLEHTDGTYYIADLNSFSGVKVNGNEIGTDHILHGGDSIEIGSAKFKYLVSG